jgi:SAM-dependent methyltransferase
MFKTLKNCRLCSGEFFENSLKLKDTPIANELYTNKESALNAERFPLELVMCSDCRHVQLKHIVNPKRLFDEYIYKSGTSFFFQKHFRGLAELIANKYYTAKDLVLEVGSNDGTLLQELRNLGVNSVGVEPSSSLVKESIEKGLLVYCSYFDDNFIKLFLEKHGKVALVVGNNVFAHIENLKSAFLNVYKILTSNGIFIFEVAHLKNILTDGIFDTIYHEHMSYHSIYALNKFSQLTGFKLFKVEKIQSHGGSLRVFLSKNLDQKMDPSVNDYLNEEIGLNLNSRAFLLKLEENISKLKLLTQKLIQSEQAKNEVKFIGYGAPAKVVTFMAQMELENLDFVGIIEDNDLKQDKFLPGSAIKIISSERMQTLLKKELNRNYLCCFIFPWNLKSEIIAKLQTFLPSGSNVVTFFPKLEEVKI